VEQKTASCGCVVAQRHVSVATNKHATRNCWKWRFVCSRCWVYIVRTNRKSYEVLASNTYIIRCHYQGTSGEDTAVWKDLVFVAVNFRVQVSENIIIICSYELWLFSKSKYQCKLQCLVNIVWQYHKFSVHTWEFSTSKTKRSRATQFACHYCTKGPKKILNDINIQ
jgi:hypothetical protein